MLCVHQTEECVLIQHLIPQGSWAQVHHLGTNETDAEHKRLLLRSGEGKNEQIHRWTNEEMKSVVKVYSEKDHMLCDSIYMKGPEQATM